MNCEIDRSTVFVAETTNRTKCRISITHGESSGQFGRILLRFWAVRHAKILNVTLGANVAVGADT